MKPTRCRDPGGATARGVSPGLGEWHPRAVRRPGRTRSLAASTSSSPEEVMMNHSTRVMRRPRRARPPAARTTAAIVATAALALLAAACGGSPSSTGSGGSLNAGGPVSSQAASSRAVAFSHCMRSHGAPAFPDPTRTGGVPKVTPQQVGVSNSQFQGAQRACAHLLQPTQAQVPQIMSGMVNFARCMRSHGVPNWPDPSTDSNGAPLFNIPGVNPDSPRISNTADECTRLLAQSATGPTTIQLCNGIGEDGGCHGYGEPPNS
jgi:hypothetical protein